MRHAKCVRHNMHERYRRITACEAINLTLPLFVDTIPAIRSATRRARGRTQYTE